MSAISDRNELGMELFKQEFSRLIENERHIGYPPESLINVQEMAAFCMDSASIFYEEIGKGGLLE